MFNTNGPNKVLVWCKNRRAASIFVAYRLIGCFFLIAAISKALSLYKVEEVLMFLRIPASMTGSLSRALIIFEIALGLLIVLGINDRLVVKVAMTTLLTFSLVIGVLLWNYPTAPPCNCAGKVDLFQTAFEDNLFGLFRNLLFLAICGLFLSNLNKFHLSDSPAATRE